MITRTRDYLARSMAPKMGLTHQDSRRYLDLFLKEITEALKRGDEVVFRGFGRFTPVEREAYNPQTQQPKTWSSSNHTESLQNCLRRRIEMFYSKPGTFYFIDRIKSWMRRQDERLWCMVVRNLG